jgi:hypothetical protein
MPKTLVDFTAVYRNATVYINNIQWWWTQSCPKYVLFNDGVNFKDYTVPEMNKNGASKEWKWWGKCKLLKEKPILVPSFLPQIPQGLAWKQTWVATVRGWWHNSLSQAQPTVKCHIMATGIECNVTPTCKYCTSV